MLITEVWAQELDGPFARASSYASTVFLARMDLGLGLFSYAHIKQSFFYDIDISGDVLKQQSKIGKVVLGLACATMALLLHEHDIVLPHRKLIVLLDPCFLLAVTCALYIVYEI
jgi:hypothetical protein